MNQKSIINTNFYLLQSVVKKVIKGDVQQIPTPIMFLDNLNQNIKSWRNPKFHVKFSFFAAIMDILNFACDVISVPLPENFLYNQLISENIEGVVFHDIFLKSGIWE